MCLWAQHRSTGGVWSPSVEHPRHLSVSFSEPLWIVWSGEASGMAHKAAVWPFTPQTSPVFLSFAFSLLSFHTSVSFAPQQKQQLGLFMFSLSGGTFTETSILIRTHAAENMCTHTGDEYNQNMPRSHFTLKSKKIFRLFLYNIFQINK